MQGSEFAGTSRTEKESPTATKAFRVWPATVGLIVILGNEFLFRDIIPPAHPAEMYIALGIAVEWILAVALLVWWAPRVEGQGLVSMGMGRFRRRYLWEGVLVYLGAAVALAISGMTLEAVGLEPIRSLQPMLKGYGFPVLFGLFLSGTFVEEVFYRGYLIERVATLTERVWLAGFASWLTFTLVHVKFFGLGPTIDVSIFSAALVLLYLRERSIWPCIIVHGINDVSGFLVFPLLVPLA